MPGDGRLELEIGADTEEASRAIRGLEDDLGDLEKAADDVGESTERMSATGVRGMADMKAAIDLLREGAEALLNTLEETRSLAESFGNEAADIQQVSRALNIDTASAQALTVAGQAAGVDATAIRGFFDPIQEFEAYVRESPFATDADRERLADLQRLGFDTAAIGEGGIGAITGTLQTLSGLSAQERAQLPAVGVSINDVQELAPFAEALRALGGGDVGQGLLEVQTRLPEPLDPLQAFEASLNAAIDREVLELGDEVRSGARQGPAGFGQILNTIQAIPLVGPLINQAGAEGGNAVFGPSDITIDMDGQQVSGSIRRDALLGRNGVTGRP